MKDEDIYAVLRIVKREIRQWPKPVLGVFSEKSATPFQILIACVLSLRTKDQTTAQASSRLFALAEDPFRMGQLKLSKLEKAIYPVGFYRTKAKQILDICQRLITQYNGVVPDSIEELLSLKGVGRKTANLVITVGYRKPGICVDIHVHRICNRWGYIKSKDPSETEELLRAKLPSQFWITFNDLLVPFGQNRCRPISPFCSTCPLATHCSKFGVDSSR